MKDQDVHGVGTPNYRGNRMEAELTRWLGGFEPAGTPISLRLRTYADLRQEAARPRPRLPWLNPALSAVASLGSAVVGAGLVLLLAVVGASIDRGGGSTGSLAGLSSVPQIPLDGNGYGYEPDPVAILLLIFASVLAGCTALIPRVQRVVSHIAVGRGMTAPLPLLPFRRSWRRVSPVAWALGALAVVVIAYECHKVLDAHYDPLYYILGADSLITAIVPVLVSFVVAWRYPLRDLSARLLVFSGVASIAYLVALDFFPYDNELLAIWVFAAVAGAAGLARRSGSVRRPPQGLAAVAVGIAFFFAAISLFIMMFGYDWLLEMPGIQSQVLGSTLGSWIANVSWLTILWIGVTASLRDRASWGWKLVLAAGAFHVLAGVPSSLVQLYQYWDPNFSTNWWSPYSPDFLWNLVANDASQVALLLALLIGLRPVRTTVQSDDEPPVAETSDAEDRSVQAPGGPSQQVQPTGTSPSAASTAGSAAT